MAKRPDTTIPLARLFRDPVLRAVFDRSARDAGSAFAVSAPAKPRLTGGAAVRVLETAEA